MRSGPWHEEDSRVSVRQGVSLMRKCTGGGGAETGPHPGTEGNPGAALQGLLAENMREESRVCNFA